MFMLCALLEHSAASVKMAAADTMAAAAKAVPVCGISFLPVLVHHLQQLAAETPDSGASRTLQTSHCCCFVRPSHNLALKNEAPPKSTV